MYARDAPHIFRYLSLGVGLVCGVWFGWFVFGVWCWLSVFVCGLGLVGFVLVVSVCDLWIGLWFALLLFV